MKCDHGQGVHCIHCEYPGAPKRGVDFVKVYWNSDIEPKKMARVFDVRPYTGKFKEEFKWVVRVEHPNFPKGIEMPVSEDWKNE